MINLFNKEFPTLLTYLKIFGMGRIGLGGFNVGLELRSGLFPTVWDSSLRMILRHSVTILISPGGDDTPALIPSEGYNLIGNLVNIAPLTDFTCVRIGVHNSVSPSEPRTQGLRSGAEFSSIVFRNCSV